ncbi:hypothetical protein OPV22_031459 [Ensete ventricosum]|uniref:SAC domain-containing protein n=1 Tax=Ensete ventricosum TaxID=4639 RepID=A0AAV8PPB7_ENSVE|nr:hypothetical protein OPV22_031459 [Ensete ventricosum]
MNMVFQLHQDPVECIIWNASSIISGVVYLTVKGGQDSDEGGPARKETSRFSCKMLRWRASRSISSLRQPFTIR